MKICKTCGAAKSLGEFSIRGDSGKHCNECKLCKSERSKRRYAEDPARHKAVTKRLYETRHRFHRYGITKQEFDQQLAAQGGRCKLCAADEPGGKGVWHIDHAHCGVKIKSKFNPDLKQHFRGILCHRCNIALGHFESLQAAVGIESVDDYLKMRPLAEAA